MFFPKDNPGYYGMSDDARKLIMEWTMGEWYESSTMEPMKTFEEGEDSKAEHQEL